MKKIIEGKTKIVYTTSNPYEVLIKNKSTLTAGDGVKKNVLEGKNIFSTTTTCNCFRLLERKGIPTHFIKQVEADSFLARKVQMIPIELVARRIATGSFLKRNPEVLEGTIFENLVIEFFFKDDNMHDPLMIWSEKKQEFELHHAKTGKFIGNLPTSPLIPNSKLDIQYLFTTTRKVFVALENALREQDISLVDMKIECGVNLKTSQIIVADVIDNDSWRIWPQGKKTKMLDKQVFRDNEFQKVKEKLKQNYALVAKMTESFIKIS